MCFEAGRCFVPEIASAHAHCDETHIIRSRRVEQESVLRRYLFEYFSTAHAQ